MHAFEAATALGYRYLDTDARVTADGVLVAFHDDDLSRTCDRPGLISDLPWSEVQAARVGGREPIPLMEDVLGTFPQARFNLDAKSERVVQPLIDAIRRTASVERVCVGAFSDKRLKEIRTAFGPTLCTSMGPTEVARWMAASVIGGWGTPSVPVAQVPLKQSGIPVVTRRSVRSADRRGVQVHVWTIDEPAEMRALLALGVDGIVSDFPARLTQVIAERS
jgi:glycerophosphoryl diester phosphodiesterase